MLLFKIYVYFLNMVLVVLFTYSDMNHDQKIFIPQGPITGTRAKKLQYTLYTYIQDMVSSSKEILEDVGDLSYMLCKVELQGRETLNPL